MKKLNLSTDDIFAALRECGYFNISQVQYAIMETNGKVSVMPKAEFAPTTNSDMQIEVDETFIPIVLISEGKIMKENASIAGLSEDEIKKIISQSGFNYSIKKILIMTVDQACNGYIQLMENEGKTFQTKRLVSQ